MIAAELTLGSVVEGIKDMIASSQAFLAAIGPDVVATDRVRYYTDESKRDQYGISSGIPRPHVILVPNESVLRFTGEGSAMDQAHGVAATFCFDAKYRDDIQDSFVTFMNVVGEIVNDVTAQSGMGGRFCISTTSMIVGPHRTVSTERSCEYDFWVMTYQFRVTSG